jgi:hypothetical protein
MIIHEALVGDCGKMERPGEINDHRGQLAAFLRPMGSRAPIIYRGSADEPWNSSCELR